MKYKQKTKTKYTFKKALFVTAATMTLGFSTIGSTAAFAAAGDKIEIFDSNKLEQSPESPEERIEKQNDTREYYQSIPEKTLTVLIMVDKGYQEAHPDWEEHTTELVKEGTKDFKEYFNIKYVPVASQEWELRGKDSTDIMYNFKDDYVSHLKDNEDFSDKYSLVIHFTTNEKFDVYGGTFPRTVGLEGTEGSSLMIIRDADFVDPAVGHTLDVASTIKHEISHTYGLPDDNGNLRNSVMGLAQESTEWSSAEMEVIDINRDLYSNKEI